MYNKQPIRLTITNQDKDAYAKLYTNYLSEQTHDKLESIESVITGCNGNHTKQIKVREILWKSIDK